MRHQVVGVVAGAIVGNIKLPQVVGVSRKVVEGVVVRAGAHAAARPRDPLLQAVVVARDNVVKAVDCRHGHAARNARSIQKDPVVAAHLAGASALKAHPLAVYIAWRVEHRAIPLDASGDLHGYDFLGHQNVPPAMPPVTPLPNLPTPAMVRPEASQ